MHFILFIYVHFRKDTFAYEKLEEESTEDELVTPDTSLQDYMEPDDVKNTTDDVKDSNQPANFDNDFSEPTDPTNLIPNKDLQIDAKDSNLEENINEIKPPSATIDENVPELPVKAEISDSPHPASEEENTPEREICETDLQNSALDNVKELPSVEIDESSLRTEKEALTSEQDVCESNLQSTAVGNEAETESSLSVKEENAFQQEEVCETNFQNTALKKVIDSETVDKVIEEGNRQQEPSEDDSQDVGFDDVHETIPKNEDIASTPASLSLQQELENVEPAIASSQNELPLDNLEKDEQESKLSEIDSAEKDCPELVKTSLESAANETSQTCPDRNSPETEGVNKTEVDDTQHDFTTDSDNQ